MRTERNVGLALEVGVVEAGLFHLFQPRCRLGLFSYFHNGLVHLPIAAMKSQADMICMNLPQIRGL